MSATYETWVATRNAISGGMYRRVAKPFFFRVEPETMHDRMTHVGQSLGRHAWTRSLTRAAFTYQHPMLEQTIHGVAFPNPVGLSAGFDKDALLVDILPSVGFGFAEVGSVTGEPCAGNPGPRLWRLPKSQSLVVYYGLKNDGAEAVCARLRGKTFPIPIGVSVAKTNNRATCDVPTGIADYAKAFTCATDVASYITVNISCPNTFGGEPFTDPARLDALLTRLDQIPTDKPIFIKLSPDLTFSTVDQLLDVAGRHRIHGVICTNLTKVRANERIKDATVPEQGGLSGKVVEPLANKLIAHVYKRAGERLTIIGCGGVFTAEDAYKKIRLGASLVQLITGMIYRGPQTISEINQGLVRLLRRDGLASISEAVGLERSS